MIKKIFPFLLFVIIGCQKEKTSITDYVNPFIGTGGHGHTYPGASAPFGMVQLSPDTRLEGWDGCGGYHYSDSIIYGFSHTHLSGTGVSDYGDILLMPTTGKLYLTNGADGNPGYASEFSHNEEIAQAGFYQVFLKDYGINVELTTSQRVGFHKYTFPKNEIAQMVLDLEHRDRLLDYKIELVDSNTVQGVRYSDNWAREQKVHFYMKFSERVQHIHYNKKQTVVGIDFGALQAPLLVKVGISAVSVEGAKANLEFEIPHWDFAKTRSETNTFWENELSKIVVEGESDIQKEIILSE